jgi:hypothetical protein
LLPALRAPDFSLVFRVDVKTMMRTALKASLMLCVLAAFAPAQGAGSEEKAHGLLVVGDEWKYEGYAQVEIVDGGRSGTSVRVKRRKAYVFKYKAQLRLRNAGAKAVKSVSWDVVFEEPGQATEAKHYPLQLKQQIAPGQTQTLVKEIHIKPEESTRHISGGTRKVQLTRVEYADGSVWRADEKSEGK